MHLSELNLLDQEAAAAEFTKCCGSSSWVQKMVKARPFSDENSLFDHAHLAWEACSEEDGWEAFTHHPKIGGKEELAKKFASTATWASGEQASVKEAGEEVLEALTKGNVEYESKFGYIFIVCATGKSAREMLDLLLKRLPNSPETEIKIAMTEQMKITLIRLQKLLEQ
jgi:2-oxo-4-hydroxy-4-carboxy-5-ureidoimidazoline decarboxylase